MRLYFDQITIKFEWIQLTRLTCAFLISNIDIITFDSFKKHAFLNIASILKTQSM